MMEKGVQMITYEYEFLTIWRSRRAQIAGVEIFSRVRLITLEYILNKFQINKKYIKLNNIASLKLYNICQILQ